MKSTHDIRQRIGQLEASQKNGVNNKDKIKLLTKLIPMSREDITTLMQLNLDLKNYQSVKELIWVLEDETNIGFSA